MKEAKFFLVVRFSIKPQAVAEVMHWLDGAHVPKFCASQGSCGAKD